MSFAPSGEWNWSKDDDVRIVKFINSNETGHNDFTIAVITRNTAEECEDELNGQISDGYFENCRTGEIEEMEVEK